MNEARSGSRASFLITIDTEGDNLWSRLREATTRNSRFLPRFRALCEKYQFKPTYLPVDAERLLQLTHFVPARLRGSYQRAVEKMVPLGGPGAGGDGGFGRSAQA